MKMMKIKYIIIYFIEKEMEFLIIYDVKIVIVMVQLLLEQNYKLFIKTKHSLSYKQHNYIKEILANNKIKKDEASENEMKFE